MLLNAKPKVLPNHTWLNPCFHCHTLTLETVTLESLNMLFELRQYRTKPGQRERWIQLMDDVIIPYQMSKGMVVVATYVGETEDDLYTWIRRFENEEERVRLYEAVY